MENKETVSRNVAIDIAKGLLILCVIIGEHPKVCVNLQTDVR